MVRAVRLGFDLRFDNPFLNCYDSRDESVLLALSPSVQKLEVVVLGPKYAKVSERLTRARVCLQC